MVPGTREDKGTPATHTGGGQAGRGLEPATRTPGENTSQASRPWDTSLISEQTAAGEEVRAQMPLRMKQASVMEGTAA